MTTRGGERPREQPPERIRETLVQLCELQKYVLGGQSTTKLFAKRGGGEISRETGTEVEVPWLSLSRNISARLFPNEFDLPTCWEHKPWRSSESGEISCCGSQDGLSAHASVEPLLSCGYHSQSGWIPHCSPRQHCTIMKWKIKDQDDRKPCSVYVCSTGGRKEVVEVERLSFTVTLPGLTPGFII